jgi:hypothetical protein
MVTAQAQLHDDFRRRVWHIKSHAIIWWPMTVTAAKRTALFRLLRVRLGFPPLRHVSAVLHEKNSDNDVVAVSASQTAWKRLCAECDLDQKHDEYVL